MRDIDENAFPKFGTWKEKIVFLLQYAVLAPSTHNSQPWLCSINNSVCTIRVNPDIHLPESDPKNYYAQISIGCFLENLTIAARHFGVAANIKYSSYSISVEFENGKQVKSNSKDFFTSILKRQNVRGEYQRYRIKNETIKSLYDLNDTTSIMNITSEKLDLKAIADLTAEAISIKYTNEDFRKEMSKWVRPSITGKKTGLHGANLRVPFLLSFILPFLIRKFNLGSVLSQLNRKSIINASGAVIISIKDYSFESLVNVGVLSQRCFLYLQSLGLHHSVFVASLETSQTRRKICSLFSEQAEPVFLFVFGVMKDKIPMSKRMDVSKIIKIIN